MFINIDGIIYNLLEFSRIYKESTSIVFENFNGIIKVSLNEIEVDIIFDTINDILSKVNIKSEGVQFVRS